MSWTVQALRSFISLHLLGSLDNSRWRLVTCSLGLNIHSLANRCTTRAKCWDWLQWILIKVASHQCDVHIVNITQRYWCARRRHPLVLYAWFGWVWLLFLDCCWTSLATDFFFKCHYCQINCEFWSSVRGMVICLLTALSWKAAKSCASTLATKSIADYQAESSCSCLLVCV